MRYIHNMNGYIFAFQNKAFSPQGQVENMDDAAIMAHNRNLAQMEVETMKQTGRAVLYLFDSDTFVGTWEGSHRWLISSQKIGGHNLCGKRLDVWFTGPDGKRWHGVNMGDNDLVRCKKLK